MDLQSTFYVVGIIFMGLMLVLLLVLLATVLVIRAKINAIHRHIEEKLSVAVNLFENGSKIVDKITGANGRKRQ